MEKGFNEKLYWNYISDTTSIYKVKLKKYLEFFWNKKGRLLDIWCNDWLFSKSLNWNFELYWIDISEKAIIKAKDNWIDGLILDLNKEKLPYDDNFFDIIIMSEVLEHIFDTDKILLEIKRVLKKDWIFWITVPNIAKHINRINLLFWKKMTDVDYNNWKFSAWHIRIYYTNILENQLKDNWFVILKKTSSFHPYWFWIRFIDYILFKMWDFFPNLGDHAVIIWKK